MIGATPDVPSTATALMRSAAQTLRMRSNAVRWTVHPVVPAMVLVVLSFALSLGYSHFLLQSIDEQALGLLENAVPSLQELATSRLQLTQFGKVVQDAINARPGGQPDAVQLMHEAGRQVALHFDAYRALPNSPEEEQWFPAIERYLAQCERYAGQVLAAAAAGQQQNALRVRDEYLRPSIERTDSALAALQRLNEAQARTHALRILQARRRSTSTATLLGAASLAIALVSTLLVLRVLRARAQLTQEYVRLLTERGAELEAFAGRVAHDLKDPLNAVALQAVAIQRSQRAEPKLASQFGAIERQLRRMNQIIEALLEFARAGAEPLADASADLAEILGGVVSAVRPRLEASQAQLDLDAVPDVRVACAPGALSSVLSNLLGNAAKYVVDGTELPHRVCVRFTEREEDVRIEVEDNGPGIPAGAELRIFEPFQRVGQTGVPGIGLGLATVRKIVESYRGQVGVHSKGRHGSVFWVELPITGAQARS
jgi:signal transduction histidine kinase